jgi:Domain of unknown function (DUF397)
VRTPDAAAPAVLTHAPYRKSNRSSGTGSCVMVGSAGGWVGIQDSKENPDSTHRTTSPPPPALGRLPARHQGQPAQLLIQITDAHQGRESP